MHFIVRIVYLSLMVILSQVQGQRVPFPQSSRTSRITRVSQFGQPRRCSPANSLYNGSPYYPGQNHYTARGTLDCCYSDETRASCCLASYYEYASGYRLRFECRCDPAVTCNSPAPCPTTAATPSTPTTTPAQKTFCPSNARPLNRALNGLPVTDNCLYQGLAEITFGSNDERTLLCQAVYTKATINGESTDVFVTANRCKTGVQNLLSMINFTLSFNDENFNLNTQNFDFVTGSDGAGYFIPKLDIPDPRSCQYYSACPYNVMSGMPPLENLTDCSFVSYGAVDTRNENAGLIEVPVKFSETGCASQISVNRITNGLCFASKSNLTLYCTGDLGAPVYCKIPETNEIVFIGNAAYQECNREPDVLVIPFSG